MESMAMLETAKMVWVYLPNIHRVKVKIWERHVICRIGLVSQKH